MKTAGLAKKPGFHVDPSQIWSFIAMLDGKVPQKLTLTSQELKDLILSENTVPVIFVSPTLNRDGVYDIYRGAGAGGRNLPGTISDILLAALPEHITHNLQQSLATEKVALQKMLSEKEGAKNSAFANMQRLKAEHEADVATKTRNAQVVSIKQGESYRLQSDAFVSELMQWSELVVMTQANSLKGLVRYVGKLTEEGQAPHANKLMVINVSKDCRIPGLGLFCSDSKFKLQQKSDQSREAYKKAITEYEQKDMEHKSVVDRLARLKKLSESEGVSFK